MEPASDLEDFLARPMGRYFVGPCYLSWSYSPSLAGSVMWGEPDQDDVRRIFRLWDFGRLLPTPAERIDVITDGSRVIRFDPAVFELVLSYARDRVSEFAARYRRHALVYPPGMAAGLMAGVLALVGSTHVMRLFDRTEPAFAWLDRPEAARAEAEVRALVEAATGTAAVVRELRHQLGEELRHVELSQVARRMGRSVRALQRELGQAGTSFRAELEQQRVAAARRLLLETDLKLELIALRVGCASLPVFSRLFRRVTGTTPSMLRRTAR